MSTGTYPVEVLSSVFALPAISPLILFQSNLGDIMRYVEMSNIDGVTAIFLRYKWCAVLLALLLKELDSDATFFTMYTLLASTFRVTRVDDKVWVKPDTAC